MRFSTYRGAGGDQVALRRDDAWFPVPGVTRLNDLLGDDGTRLRAAGQAAHAAGVTLDPGRFELCAPIPEPPAIRDFMAFEEHVVTASAAIGLTVDPLWYSQPVFYFTNPAAVFGPYADIPVPPGSEALDYELEVAAVIGRAGSDLAADEAAAHIAGFVLFCDWSARDLQGAEMRLNLGPAKGKDSANGFGPWLVTPEELGAPAGRGYDVELTASVNGEPCSRGNLRDLYWSFGEMIAYASRGTRLRPGDVIGSGTVGTGCLLELSRVHGADRYPYLQPGDQVRLDGGVLGAIEARIVPGPAPIPLRPNNSATGGDN